MTTTLQQAITSIRSAVDEATSRFWSDTELTTWVNDACRDIGRRAEVVQSFYTALNAVVGTGKYALPSNVVRVHRVEFVPTGSSQTYVLEASTYQEMDRIWGWNQTIQSSYPRWFVIWGMPGGAGDVAHQIQFFPVPSQTGVFNIFYYREPYQFLDPIANPAEYAKNLEVPEGWQDAVVDFAEYRAKRKNRDPTWQEAKQLYEEKLEQMVDVTRQWHDQARFIYSPSGQSVPMWLVAGGDE